MRRLRRPAARVEFSAPPIRARVWEKRNEFDAGAMCDRRVVADPKNIDRIFVMNVNLRQSLDGGKTLKNVTESNHPVTITRCGSIRITRTIGCSDRTVECTKHSTTPNTGSSRRTCRRCSSTMWRSTTHCPFKNVCGGTQDYFSWCGPYTHSQCKRHYEFGLVHDDSGGGWVPFASRSSRRQYGVLGIAIRCVGALRQADRPGRNTSLDPPYGEQCRDQAELHASRWEARDRSAVL